MAPSQQESNTFEYTHKKFNCGYSHKKLGMRLIRRNSQEDLKQEQQHLDENKTNKNCASRNSPACKTLFRPYALEKESSKKINISSTPAPVMPSAQSFANNTTFAVPQLPYHLYQTPQQSQEEYALKLQRQRAALYMKHVMQFYENGNGWPSVHPNALNNSALYQQH